MLYTKDDEDENHKITGYNENFITIYYSNDEGNPYQKLKDHNQ